MRPIVVSLAFVGIGAWLGTAIAKDPQRPARETLPAPVTRPPATESSIDASSDRDAYDLVLLAPAHPVFIRVAIQVDGAGLKSVRFAYAEQLLQQNDRNGDGFLEKDEASHIPPLVKSANASETLSVSESWVSVDRDPADDKVSVAELADWIDRILGFPFSLVARPQRSTQSVDLFGLLDTNRDDRLSREEQAAAERTLHKLDLDEDETFTIEELQPMLSMQARAAAADPNRQKADQPFLLLSDSASLTASAQRIMQRYAPPAERSQKPLAGLNAAALGIDDAELARNDANRDGLLNQAELAHLLKNPIPHVELLAQLPQSKPGKPQLDVIADRISAVIEEQDRKPDRLTIVTNTVRIEWRVQAQRSAVSDNRNLYKVRFISADKDKNKYLDEREFGAVSLSGATFAQVDRDGNGMVVLDELLAFINQEAAASQSRIEMTVSHNGKSVFEILDVNLDRRITRRELRRTIDLLRGYDRDGDATISTIELTGQFLVTIGLGKPIEFRNQNALRADGMNTMPVVNRPLTGPGWFVKMDRNRDGDVSRHEFLGPPALFLKLDTDGDGLLSASEVEITSAE